MRLQFQLFGDFAIRLQGASSTLFGSTKEALLLAYLAHFPGWHPREKLASLFWSQAEPEHARVSLRVALFHLRQHLGDILQATRTHVRLDPFGYQCDSRLFIDLAEQAFATVEPALSQQIIKEALLLYRGEFLPIETPPQWVLEERNRLQQIHQRLTNLLEVERDHAASQPRLAQLQSGLYFVGYIQLIPPPALSSQSAVHTAFYRRIKQILEAHTVSLHKVEPLAWYAIFATPSAGGECFSAMLEWVDQSGWQLRSVWDIVEANAQSARPLWTKTLLEHLPDTEPILFSESALAVWRTTATQLEKPLHFEPFRIVGSRVYYRGRYEVSEIRYPLLGIVPFPKILLRNTTFQRIVEALVGEQSWLVCLTGPPGSGKTYLARQAIRTLEPMFGSEAVFLYGADPGHPILYEHQLYAALMHAVGSLRRLPIALRLEPRIVYIDTDSVSESLMCFLERLHRECPRWKVLLTTVEGEIPSEATIIPIELFSREPICGESSLGVQYLQMELRARHRNATPIRPYLHELSALCDSTPSALRLTVGLLEQMPIEDLITHLREHRRQHPEQSGMDAVVHIAMQSLPPDAQNLVLDMSLIESPIGYPALISLFEGDDVEPTVRWLCEIGLIEPLEHSQAPLFVVRGSVRRCVLRALHESDAVSERMSLLFQRVSQWLQELLSRVGCPETDKLVYESPPMLASLLRWAVANAPQACAELLIRLSNRWSVMGLAEVSLHWLQQLVPSAETLSSYLQARILIEKARAQWLCGDHGWAETMQAYADNFLTNPELKAVHPDYYHIHASRALEQGLHEDALKAISKGMKYFEWASPQRRIALMITRGNVLLAVGKLEQACECYFQAHELARAENNRLSESTVRAILTDLLTAQGRYEEAEQMLAPLFADPELEIYTANYADWLTAPAILALYRNDLSQACRFAEESFHRHQSLKLYQRSALAGYLYGIGLALAGYWEAVQRLHRQLRLLFQNERTPLATRILDQLEGILLLEQGAYEHAAEILNRSIEGFNPFDGIPFYICGMIYLTQAYHKAQKKAQAQQTLEQLNTFLSTYRLVVPGGIEPLYHTLQQELQPNQAAPAGSALHTPAPPCGSESSPNA